MKPTVAVAVPAYNEEANIAHLIHDIVVQVADTFTLREIIIASDGSTDETVAKARSIGDPRVTVIDNSDNQGVAARTNQMFAHATSDILVLLNADTAIVDPRFIEKVIAPIAAGRADLTSAALHEVVPDTVIERVLHTSMKIKEQVFLHMNDGRNLYTCHGPVRAFSKRLYKNITITLGVGDDAFCYLYAVKNGYGYEYVPETGVVYKLPSTFGDHKSQSHRFFRSQELLAQEFGEDVVKREYRIPLPIALKYVLLYAMQKPFDVIAYAAVIAYLKVAPRHTESTQRWAASKSSKLIRI